MIRITFTSVLSRPNLIHVRFRVAKMNSFSPSVLRGSGQKYHFCPPQADVNSVVPQQNGRKRSIFSVDEFFLVMEKSPVISKAQALGLTRALKLITRAFLGFADPIDFTNVTDLISLYTVQYTILDCFLEL